jgi:hypothetical protein
VEKFYIRCGDLEFYDDFGDDTEVVAKFGLEFHEHTVVVPVEHADAFATWLEECGGELEDENRCSECGRLYSDYGDEHEPYVKLATRVRVELDKHRAEMRQFAVGWDAGDQDKPTAAEGGGGHGQS